MWRQIFQLKLAVCPESHGPEEFFEEGMEPLQLRQFATLLYEQNKGRITGVFPEMMKLVCISMLLAAARQI